MVTTDEQRWDEALRINLARLLRKVEELALELHAQALASPNDHDFPGGTALHMLGPAASIADWEAGYEKVEQAERFDTKTGQDRWLKRNTDTPTSNWRDPAVYQGNTEEQPLNVLESWTRMVREERDQPTSLKPTLSREVDYLRKNLDWICGADEHGEPTWMFCFEMESEIKTLVRRMEDVLTTGHRVEVTRVRCTHCVDRTRLVRQYHDGVRLDAFRCPDCRQPYTWSEFMNAYHQNLDDEGADKFLLVSEAMDAVKVPAQTMRSWMRRLTVRSACDIKTKRLIVWWPDVRDQAKARRAKALTKSAGVGA